MQYADQAELSKKGRNFNCAKCPKNIQKLRRCWEPRWDFTAEDHNIFPIRIHEGGGLYGFCPSKATRDHEAVFLFETLVIACEQKALLVAGGIADQPYWFIEQLSWFATEFDKQKFISKARMILGDGSSSKTSNKK